MRRTIWLSFVVLLAAATGLIARYLLPDDVYEVPVVHNILDTQQTYDGEHIDKLVALGPDAIPSISELLDQGVEFPVVLILALEGLGDPRGAPPILAFIEERDRFESPDASYVTALAVNSLREIPNADSCTPLGNMMRGQDAHPRVRLASASTVARLCGESEADEATEVLSDLHAERSDFLSDVNEGFTQEELYSALAGSNRAEFSDILLGVVGSISAPPILLPIIQYTEGREGEELGRALTMIVNNEELALSVRLASARSLLNRGESGREFEETIEELQLEAESGDYPSELIEEARRLNR